MCEFDAVPRCEREERGKTRTQNRWHVCQPGRHSGAASLVLCSPFFMWIYIVVSVAIYNLSYVSLTMRKWVTQRMERTAMRTRCPVASDMLGEAYSC